MILNKEEDEILISIKNRIQLYINGNYLIDLKVKGAFKMKKLY